MARGKNVRKRKKKTVEFPLDNIFLRRAVLILMICVVVIGGSLFCIRWFLCNSGFFSVKEIIVYRDRNYAFRDGAEKMEKLYAGKNIFTLDLANIKKMIEKDFPQLQRVEVSRHLPDRIKINVVSRAPAAVIDTAGGIVIDKDGVVLATGEKSGSMIKIRGVRFFINVPSTGRRIRSRALERALLLLKELRRQAGGDVDEVEYVDVADRNNTLLGVRGVTVKMGKNDVSEKIDELKEILEDPDIDLGEINYIDLRFEKPVMSPK